MKYFYKSTNLQFNTHTHTHTHTHTYYLDCIIKELNMTKKKNDDKEEGERARGYIFLVLFIGVAFVEGKNRGNPVQVRH